MIVCNRHVRLIKFIHRFVDLFPQIQFLLFSKVPAMKDYLLFHFLSDARSAPFVCEID